MMRLVTISITSLEKNLNIYKTRSIKWRVKLQNFNIVVR